MINVLRMDLYRFRKSKLFYLILAVTFLVTLIGLVGLNLSHTLVAYLEQYVSLTDLNSDLVDTFLYALPDNYTDYMCVFFSGNYATLYIMIFALLFYNAEYRNGYIKNTLCRARTGGALVFSRLILITLITVILYVMIAAMVTISCLLTGRFDPTEVGPLVKVFFTGILLNVAITSFCVMLFLLWRNIIPAMISGICYVLLAVELLTVVDKLIQIVPGYENFDLNRFLCIGNLVYYNIPEESAGTFIRMIGIAVVVLAASTAISIISLKKKDI